jgi:Putative zinc-finger
VPYPGAGNESSECDQPALNRLVTTYCFGEATEEQRRQFEEHLLACPFCQNEVERLSAAVGLLRADKSIRQAVSRTDIYRTVGPSAKADFRLCGHVRHVLLNASLYGILFVFILFIEITYEFDKLAHAAIIFSPFVFLANFGAMLACLQWLCLSVRREKSRLFASFALLTLVSLATLLILSLLSVLPNHAVTRNHTSGYTAQTAYLKDIVYILPVAFLFVLRPFRFAVVMQKKLVEGRHSAALPVLAGERRAAPPQGVAMPSTGIMAVVALGIGLFMLGGLMRLLDSLESGTFTRAFTVLIFIRFGCYFGWIAEAFQWYINIRNEMLRECLAVVNTERSPR